MMDNGINTTSSEDMQKKRNFAFISYNHKDVKWAKWLRKRLEWYRMPSEIHNDFSDYIFFPLRWGLSGHNFAMAGKPCQQ